jgi:hypothetical protein
MFLVPGSWFLVGLHACRPVRRGGAWDCDCKVDRVVPGTIAIRFEQSERDFPVEDADCKNPCTIEPRHAIWKKCALCAMSNKSPMMK